MEKCTWNTLVSYETLHKKLVLRLGVRLRDKA